MHHYFIKIGNKLEIRSARKDNKQNLLSHIKSQNSACSIPIRSIENNPAVIHVAPISSNKTDLYDLKNPYLRYFENNSFILVLSPIVAGAESSSELIKSLFDLTKTEAKIAAKLSAGLSIDDISSELKTTKDTVRTHIKNIYSKTCVHSQGQLVALISGVQAI
jgi:DNA-binding CsgD family transcriptional regulator